jgi:hypothetical protein
MGHDGRWTASLAQEEWTFHVVAPVLAGGVAVIGDVSKFVTAGDARIEVTERAGHDELAGRAGGITVVVKGAGERVTITGWAEHPPSRPDAPVAHDRTTGIWTTVVDVPARGWTSVELRPG